MTQVRSSGATLAPSATPVSTGKAQAAAQPEKKIAVPHAAEARPAAGSHPQQTQVTFGERALHALENTGEFIGKAVLAGVEDVGEAAYYTARAVGKGVVEGIADSASAIGHGIVHVEKAVADAWGVATQGASEVTTLASTLGNEAEVAVTNLGTAATDVGVGAKAMLSGVGSIAGAAASYGNYVVRQGGKVIDELT